jgi:hypothetical protein
MREPAETVTLPLNCPKCGGPVTCQFVAWSTEAPVVPVVWTCPYCRAEHRFFDAPGRLAWVTEGHDDDRVQ